MIALTPSNRTLPALLTEAARLYGDRTAVTVGDVSLTYGELADAASSEAAGLVEAGIRPGDRVAALSENRWELLSLFLGCAWTGAVFVPLNAGARGAQLEHMLLNAAPRMLGVEAGLEDRFDLVTERPVELERCCIFGSSDSASVLDLVAMPLTETGLRQRAAASRPGDLLAILYTSGTTGPSKGVACPHAQFTWWAENLAHWLDLRADDVLYTCLPLFHVNALHTLVQSMMVGGHFVLGSRFSASNFWKRIVEAEATVTYLLGAMVSILLANEPTPLDRGHRVRVTLAPGTPAPAATEFQDRFNVRLVEGHGMTETNAVIGPRDGLQRPGWMGRVMPGFEAKVVDDDDLEVAPGEPGELIMRAAEPFAFASGYWRMPEATVEAWRNLWFHSGDRVLCDEEGFFRFLDRKKDAIRRRGENISAWEVEQVMMSHPSVELAAVFGVPSELGEDDVMACIVVKAGHALEPEELIRHSEPLLASFAIPRYVEFLPTLPQTDNGKVAKAALRERGVRRSTWDRNVPN